MKKINKYTYILTAILALVIFIFSSLLGGGVGVAYAATSTTTDFEKSEVMDDLKTATIKGKPFNIIDYPYDSTGVVKHPEILTVVEYCYSMRASQRGNYGLYIYFYNPQCLNISTTSEANKIMLGVKYGTDNDGKIKCEDYEKFNLKFCSKSTGDYRDLFYKFKVVDHRSTVDGLMIEQRVNTNSRRYDISEVELLTFGNRNATAYTVGGTYTFTGYAKGYGADTNAESTLACSWNELETVTLDLAGVTDGIDKRTYWRSNSSSKGENHQNQINSVFFAIDTNLLEKFGYTLQRIKAEWWEYKTAPAVVISNGDIYNRLSEYNGVKITRGRDYSRGIELSALAYYLSYPDNAGTITTYNYSWNAYSGVYYVNQSFSSYYTDLLLPLLFYSNGISVDDYTLTADTLQEYCEQYDKSFDKGTIAFNEHSFSADLFMDSVDEGRTTGYNLREFDITNPDDLLQINSYDSTHNWWQKFLDYGFGSITTNDDYADILPIQMLKAEDFLVSNISNHLKVNPDDISRLRDYYNSSTQDTNNDGKPDNQVFLFRYAQTDYYAQNLYVQDFANGQSYSSTNNCIGEVRQGTQIFDFDILTMTFNKDGELTTLGCVSSPVDHWTAYTPSIEPTTPDWWTLLKYILGILAVIIIIVLLYPILSPILGVIVKGILWLIALPFRLIGKLFKRKKE